MLNNETFKTQLSIPSWCIQIAQLLGGFQERIECDTYHTHTHTHTQTHIREIQVSAFVISYFVNANVFPRQVSVPSGAALWERACLPCLFYFSTLALCRLIKKFSQRGRFIAARQVCSPHNLATSIATDRLTPTRSLVASLTKIKTDVLSSN